MPSVTSAEFQRHFGVFKEAARHEPVTITSDGDESLVLLSAAEYRRLKALEPQAYYAHELPDELKAAIDAAEPPSWTSQFDHELD